MRLALPTQNNPNIYTVSRLNSDVRLLLENEMGIVWLVGEISNFTCPVSGHWYLTLKDSRAQVKCAMFRGNNRRVTFKPENGKQVLVKARLSLYEPRGDYQLIIESMQPEGDGKLQQEFDALKMKLAAEGLFSQANKLAIPEHPKCVGIVTSKTGAALFDILNVLKRRDPTLPVIIYPTLVQGEDAAIHIAQAIGRANEHNQCDVLIVGRGGGSLEDLWSFNHEIVARTIDASQIPIVSAVGHEVDVTIADFVADLRAPTPSAAAELVSADQSHKTSNVNVRLSRLKQAMSKRFIQFQQQLTSASHQLDLQHPTRKIDTQSQKLDELTQRLMQATQSRLRQNRRALEQQNYRLKLNSPQTSITHKKQRLNSQSQRLQSLIERLLASKQHAVAQKVGKLDAVSPLATLSRGYSITQSEKGDVIRNQDDVKSGDTIVTRLNQGTIRSTVD